MQKKIADEIGLRYNGMLASVFELLAEARQQATSVNAAIDAQRDFWVAETDLQMAINGNGANSGVTTDMRSKPLAADAKAGR